MSADVKPLISVVIVNWNGLEWLKYSLPALVKQSYWPYEIIVVDNGSRDGSLAWLQESWPKVQLLSLPTNEGFSAANNRGMARAKGEWIATLNNDTIVHGRWLENLVRDAEEQSSEVGMLASLIVYWDKPEIVDAAGFYVDRAGFAWNRGHGLPAEQFSQPCEVFGAPASAAFYRREMLEQVGGFDESYFAYYEDVDLAWRARRAGWTCHYCPQARVRHWHSATAKRMLEQKVFLQSRNRIWTIAKNYQRPELVRSLPLILFYDLLSLFYRFNHDRNLASLRGRIAALRGLHRISHGGSGAYAVPLAAVRPPWHLRQRQGADGLSNQAAS